MHRILLMSNSTSHGSGYLEWPREHLVDFLDDPDAGIQRAALTSLQQLSGVRRDWDAARWTRWRCG